MIKQEKIKIIKTIIWLIVVARAAPETPIFKVKINIGSSMIFSIVPDPATNIGNLVSPSPTNIDLKNADNTINGNPKQINFK